jgi:hypothetical protein
MEGVELTKIEYAHSRDTLRKPFEN